MPQTFQVVRCCECSTYQVDIKKQSTNKWTCKICNTKQSLKQVYFQGESNECREKVRILNQMRLETQDKKDQLRLEQLENYALHQSEQENTLLNHNDNSIPNPRSKVNKWVKYLDESDNDF